MQIFHFLSSLIFRRSQVRNMITYISHLLRESNFKIQYIVNKFYIKVIFSFDFGIHYAFCQYKYS